MRAVNKRFLLLMVYAAAMGFVEAAVVVYLRQLYYPSGFHFPLETTVLNSLWIEYIREIATVVMLASLAVLAGRDRTEKTAVFLFSFGLWDLFYYLWLKLLIGWPSSFFIWDVLFLIPVIWAAPVLAPILCSITMIAIGLSFIGVQKKRGFMFPNKIECIFFTAGCLTIIFTFVADYSKLVLRRGLFGGIINLAGNQQVPVAVSQYIPTAYNWGFFILGEFAVIGSMLMFWMRNSRGFSE